MQRILLIALSSVLLSSCFIIEEYENAALEESKTVEKSRQDIVQDSVIACLTRLYEGDLKYLPYTFGSVYANKPQEIVELEQLYELKSSLPTMQEHYGSRLDSVIDANDKAISKKQSEIRENRIYSTYDLTHLYCVEDKKNKTTKVVETKFYTYPNNQIKDMEVVFTSNLDASQFELFEHYIHQDPLIFDNDYSYQSQKNKSAYTKMNQAMMDEPHESKADLLNTILLKVKFYKKHNAFDSELFTNLVLSEWTFKPTLKVKIASVIKTSKLMPIRQIGKSEEGSISYEFIAGYKKFMLINGTWDNDYQEEKAVYCEFDQNHVLKGVLLVDGEHEKYFE
jgi:hypothetical protein